MLSEEIIRENLSRNIKWIRKQYGHTQSQFADVLGIDIKRLGKWEENRARPPLAMIIHISETTSIDMKSMLTKDLSRSL